MFFFGEEIRSMPKPELKLRKFRFRKKRPIGVSEQSDSTLEVVSSPERKRIELVSVHVEGHLEVGVGQVLLEVAPVDVRRKFVVAGEEKVKRVGFVVRDRRRGRGGRVVRSERMGRHHVEAGIRNKP